MPSGALARHSNRSLQIGHHHQPPLARRTSVTTSTLPFPPRRSLFPPETDLSAAVSPQLFPRPNKIPHSHSLSFSPPRVAKHGSPIPLHQPVTASTTTAPTPSSAIGSQFGVFSHADSIAVQNCHHASGVRGAPPREVLIWSCSSLGSACSPVETMVVAPAAIQSSAFHQGLTHGRCTPCAR